MALPDRATPPEGRTVPGDSSVAARHAVVLPVVGYEVYGKALLDREDHITPLV